MITCGHKCCFESNKKYSLVGLLTYCGKGLSTSFSHSFSRCYIATASPAKFQKAVQTAGLTFELPEAVQALDKLATCYQNLERSLNWCKDWEDKLREKIQSLS